MAYPQLNVLFTRHFLRDLAAFCALSRCKWMQSASEQRLLGILRSGAGGPNSTSSMRELRVIPRNYGRHACNGCACMG